MTPGYLEFDNPGYKELEMHSKSVVSCILTSDNNSYTFR